MQAPTTIATPAPSRPPEYDLRLTGAVRLTLVLNLERLVHIPQTLELVNTNVEQLNFFLSYYNDMRLQWQGQKANQLTLLLTVVLMFMALSSFLSDTFNLLDTAQNPVGPFSKITWALFSFGLLLLAVVIWQGRRLARSRRK